MEPTGDLQRTSEAQYGANQSPFPAAINQVNLSSSTSITDRKGKIYISAAKNVNHGVNLLRNRVYRRLEAVKSVKRKLEKANVLPEQIEKLESWEPKLEKIQNITKIRRLQKSNPWPELFQGEKDLEECLQLLSEVRRKLPKVRRQQSELCLQQSEVCRQLSEVRQELSEARQQQSEVLEGTRKLGEIILNIEDYPVLPSMEDILTLYTPPEPLPSAISAWDFQICDNDSGLSGIPLGNTISCGMLQQSGSGASEAQYSMNAPPLSQSNIQMNLKFSGSNKRDGESDFCNLSEAGGKGSEISDVIPIDQHCRQHPFKMVGLGGNERIIMIPTPGAPNGGNGQPSPDDNQVNPSSLMLTGLKKSIQKAKGKGVEKQSRGRLTGESSNLGVENSEDLFRVKPQTLFYSDDHGSLPTSGELQSKINELEKEIHAEDSNKVNFQDFPALQHMTGLALPDDLKPIAIRIDQARGKATECIKIGSQLLVCAAIKEMEDLLVKDLDKDRLKKWGAALKSAKEQDFQVEFADNLLRKQLVFFAVQQWLDAT